MTSDWKYYNICIPCYETNKLFEQTENNKNACKELIYEHCNYIWPLYIYNVLTEESEYTAYIVMNLTQRKN